MINSRFFSYLLTFYAVAVMGSIVLAIADPFNVYNEATEMAFEKFVAEIKPNQRPSYMKNLGDAFGFLVIFLFIISIIGMFFRKSSARYTYPLYFFVTLFWSAFFDDDISYSHRIGDSLDWLIGSLEGAILILVLFLNKKIGFPDRH
jgi:hypothetical protein